MIDELKTVNAIKAMAIAEISKAKSGHPGIALGAANILYTLYANHMRVDVTDDKWINRDRFVMSAGHGSSLLYATLYMSGFNLTIKDLKEFRQLDSLTPGHPEVNTTPGVDASTGALGQGFATAVGMAAAEKYLKEQITNLIDYNVYVLCGDGDLMEGVSYEAASLAGKLGLNNLIVLYDSNDVTLDGELERSCDEDILRRFDAMGWHTDFVADGSNNVLIDNAIAKAKTRKDKPTIIEIKTMIGKGSMLEGTNKVHGAPLSKEDIRSIKEKLGLDSDLFKNIKELRKQMANFIRIRVSRDKRKWTTKYDAFINTCQPETKRFVESLTEDKRYEVNRLFSDYIFEADELRKTNGKIMNVIADNFTSFIGGSADLSSSCRTYLTNYKLFGKKNYDGKNIAFGVREHAMGAFINGLALSGLRPFSSTHFAFSDYMKPAIRMASLMNIPSTFIFTHDSIMNGQDGPTHQPVEQLAMLRSIPNHYVYRPCDANEIVGSWQCILNYDKPASLVISKEKLPTLDSTSASNVKNGAYIVRKEKKKLYGIIIATGSEVEVALKIADKLAKKKIDLRVVSMPCMELFEKQTTAYKDEILPIGYKTFVIERAGKFGWHKYVYNDKYIMGVDSFGLSAPKNDVLKTLKLDEDSISRRIEKLLK